MSDAIDELLGSPDLLALLGRITGTDGSPGVRIDAGEGDPAKGLAQLVLTVVDLLRDVMERQASRRIRSGSLSDEQIDRLGSTFLALNERMDELCEAFDLEREDLRLDLLGLKTR